MKKNILIFFALLCTIIGHAKYYKAILYLNNGTSKVGLAKFVEDQDSKVNFKTDENAKEEKIASDELFRIKYTLESRQVVTMEYLFASTPNVFTGKLSSSKKKCWFAIIYDKDVKIGCKSSKGSMGPNAGGTSMIINSPSTVYFFGMKKSDTLVFGHFITDSTLFAVGTEAASRKMSREAFADCPKLIEAIEKEDFKLKTVLDQMIAIFDSTKCK